MTDIYLDVRDSFRLAMESAGLDTATVQSILTTVDDAVDNHIERPDYIVRALVSVMLRVEGMDEDMVKAQFDDLAREQRLSERLQDAVEDTDFHILMDLSDLEVEAD